MFLWSSKISSKKEQKPKEVEKNIKSLENKMKKKLKTNNQLHENNRSSLTLKRLGFLQGVFLGSSTWLPLYISIRTNELIQYQ